MQGPTEEMEELDELELLPGPVASAPAPAVDEEPIPPVFITETRASVDEHVVAEEASAAQVFPILEVSQKISQKSVHHPLTSSFIPDSVYSGPTYLPSTSSTPQASPMSVNLPPSASISPPPTKMAARDWSPRLPLASSLVDGSPLRPRFLKRVAHHSTSQLENSFIRHQLKTLQPPQSPPPSRKTGRRNLVGAQSCEGDLPPPDSDASSFLKFTIIFIIFVLILCFTFLYH